MNGALLDSNLATGLIHNMRNSTTPGVYVFPVRNGAPPVPTADLEIAKTDSQIPSTAGRTSPTRSLSPTTVLTLRLA